MNARVAVQTLELYYVRPRWQFLRVTTDAGVEGWSEAVVEGNVRAVRGAEISISAGMIAAPPGPGLGVSVNLEEVLARQHDGTWRSPELSYGDGSVAPW